MELSICLLQLTKNGYKSTCQRKALIAFFLEKNRTMLSAKEVWEYITHLTGKQASFGNVYHNLYLLCALDIICKTDYCGEAFFYLKEMSQKKSVLFICTHCRKITYFPNSLLEQTLKKEEKEHAYKVTDQKFEIYGFCPDCQQSG